MVAAMLFRACAVGSASKIGYIAQRQIIYIINKSVELCVVVAVSDFGLYNI